MAHLPYRPEIDGLRAVAVISVFIFHLNHQWLPGGFLGVDVFFVISGFLITSLLLNDHENAGVSLSRFYQRRIARIFPAFFTVALATIVGASLVYSSQDFAVAGSGLAAAILSVANLRLMLWGDYFAMSSDAEPFLHYWSLSVEEQFYVLFPLLLWLLLKHARIHARLLLSILCLGAFLSCILMTRWKPTWSFYLLPTRAWELLAGCILSMAVQRWNTPSEAAWRKWSMAVGLIAIAFSLCIVHEGMPLPGWWSLLPVCGTVFALIPSSNSIENVRRLLAAWPVVLIGRMSYSLYLWHWPVFSLVDYGMYMYPEVVRLATKITTSCACAAVSYWIIENPARQFLNQPKNRQLAYLSLLCALVVCFPLGVLIRKGNYYNVKARDVSDGGLVFASRTATSSVVLMGDSHASMYGKLLKDICESLNYKLIVISAAGGDPLPRIHGSGGRLWSNSLALVTNSNPTCLVLACDWTAKLRDDRCRIELAVEALKPHVGHLILLNQPPVLPKHGNREAIRGGITPPFYEEVAYRTNRQYVNALLGQCASVKVSIVDVASRLEGSRGQVLFSDEHGKQLYHDASHLSASGAERIRQELQEALMRGTESGTLSHSSTP